MKLLLPVLRIGLGVMLLVFGVNKFFWFLTDFDFSLYPEAEHLFNSFRYSSHTPTGKGYVMHMVGIAETLIGLLLILKKWVPFALVALVPISINLVAFHVFVNLPNIVPALLVAFVNAYLIYSYWPSYRPMFR